MTASASLPHLLGAVLPLISATLDAHVVAGRNDSFGDHPTETWCAISAPNAPLRQELSTLLRFSLRFNLSTRFRCIFSAIFSYLSFSSFLARFSRMA